MLDSSERHVADVHIRVRYAETDQMGVAHHANYLIWFELARSEYCRKFGIDYKEMEQRGLFLPIVEVHCRYKNAARYDDEITVRASVIECKRRTLRMSYHVLKGDMKIAEGQTLQMLVDKDSRPRAFPSDIAQIFQQNVT